MYRAAMPENPAQRAMASPDARARVAAEAAETAREGGDPRWSQVTDPSKRAYLAAFAVLGRRLDAATAAGVGQRTLYGPSWSEDATFRAAEAEAERLYADQLEDEADRRAREGTGLRRYKFVSKTGEPLLHPDLCDCGHARAEHVRKIQTRLVVRGTGAKREEEHVTETVPGMCSVPECTCSAFLGAPYFEVDPPSEALLLTRLRTLKPERYREDAGAGRGGVTVIVVGPGGPKVASVAAGVQAAEVVGTGPLPPRALPPGEGGEGARWDDDDLPGEL